MTCIDTNITSESWDPDLVLTDLHPPAGRGDVNLPAARSRSWPAMGVLVLSPRADASHGFDVDDLVSAIDELAGGGWAAPLMVPHRRTHPDLSRLTSREREVLAEMAQGKNNAAIAASLVLSQRAVEKHGNSIFSKLGLTEEPNVNRRVKAVLLHLEATKGTAAA